VKGDVMHDKPGEHPLTDILHYKLEVYGPEIDDLIRGISDFSSRRELHEWWTEEINWSKDRAMVLSKAQARLAELLQRSSSSGWGSQ
jgi:hypothetical protein